MDKAVEITIIKGSISLKLKTSKSRSKNTSILSCKKSSSFNNFVDGENSNILMCGIYEDKFYMERIVIY